MRRLSFVVISLIRGPRYRSPGCCCGRQPVLQSGDRQHQRLNASTIAVGNRLSSFAND